MNVLVVGYGSIGKRHVDNLASLDGVKKIIVCTKFGLRPEEREVAGKVEFETSLSKVLNAALAGSPIDFAIIANDTSRHVETALILAKAGLHLFVEKPLSHNLVGVEQLRDISEIKGLKIFVGYNLRFLDAIKYLKDELSKGTIGKPYFAKIEVGHYLPSWRPDRDYKDSYSAKKGKGGGVALDLSHEIDYMRYLFGDPFDWYCVKNKVSDLAIDSDDIFEAIYQYKNGFICNIHMDYLQMDKKRKIKIVGSRGTIECDFIKKFINIFIGVNDQIIIEDHAMFDVNKTYVDELTSYIESIEKDNEPLINLTDGVQAIRLTENKNV